MNIQGNVVVHLNYKLSNNKTGETIEETTTENPLVFLYGVGSMIPQFEENIEGKVIGDQCDFVILADHAYGISSAEQIVEIPLDVFKGEDGTFDANQFPVGSVVPMSDSEGNHLRGTVRSITDKFIKMDFNHPLADTDLKFEVEILHVREATQDELDHGHVHGEHGHQH
jgi:FKBP-type peptidyl-prolyl cis-trans isomerase SlyD